MVIVKNSNDNNNNNNNNNNNKNPYVKSVQILS